MRAYYCGFNGFGQFPNRENNNFSIFTPTVIPFDIIFVSCAWNRICFSTGSELYLSGLIDEEFGKLEKLSIPVGKKVTQGSCSRSNILVITEDGDCWIHQFSGAWKNISDLLKTEVDSHELINENLSTESSSNDHRITKVCCGDKLNLAICNLGQIYCIPSALPIPRKKVVEISCGFDHCLALTEDSIVYSWGSGRRGQLGHDVLEDEDSPRELEMLSGLQVKNISAGGWHSVAVTSAGDAYVWGWNSSGQLGLPCSEIPKRVDEEMEYTMPHSVDTSTPSGSSEEAGGDTKEITTIQALPVPINFPPGDEGKLMIAASCGSRHTVILTDDGTAWGCGWNLYGQLGFSDWCLYNTLSKITIPGQDYCKIINVECGSWSTVLFVDG
ncbi:RCC1 domain-containing protein 1 [Hetaerina americana]|uniref:RCC1 domain-containing protein 1 n=1 Tax=Hetaerina americana TaxID=62018 RepID=UPI003A7F1AD0